MRQPLANIVKRSIAHGTKKHQYFGVIETFSTDSTPLISRAAFLRRLN